MKPPSDYDQIYKGKNKLKILSKPSWKLVYKDSFYYLLNKLIPGLFGLASVVIFIRLVGADGYGLYTLYLTFIMAVGAMTAGWLNQAILRYFSRYKDRHVINRVVQYGFLVSIFGGIALLVIAGYFFLNVQMPLFIVLSCLLISVIFFKLRTSIYMANLEPRRVTRMVFVQSILGLVIPILFLLYFSTYNSILLGLALAFFIPGLFKSNIKKAIKYLNVEYIAGSTEILKKFLKFGLPISMRLSIGLLIPFFDRFWIRFFFGIAQTGVYASFSELIVRIFSVILVPITLAVHPRLTHHWNRGEEDLTRGILKHAIYLQLGIFAFTFLVCLVFKSLIFELVQMALPSVDDYYENLLLPLLVSGFLWEFAQLMHKPLELGEMPIYMVLAASISLGISIVGNVVFLPKFGVIATVYSSIVSSTVYICLVVLFSNRGKFQFSMFRFW